MTKRPSRPTGKTQVKRTQCAAWLDSPTSDLLAGQYLVPFVVKAYAAGLTCVGHIVQLNAEYLFDKIPTSKRNQREIAQRLKNVGLHFGMELKSWRPPARGRMYELLRPHPR